MRRLLDECRHDLEGIIVPGVPLVDPLADLGRGVWEVASFAKESLELAHAAHLRFQRLAEGIRCDRVIVATVTRTTRPHDDAEMLEPARVGADARLADAERLGHVVKGTFPWRDDQKAEDPPGDAGQTICLAKETDAFDELAGAGMHGVIA